VTEPGEARQQYVGQSLAYVRMLVGAKAHYPSAKAAAADLHLSVTLPPLGAVLFYDSEPWGNVGLHVGNHRVLTVDREGKPVLWPLFPTDNCWGGAFLGWCPSSALREAGEHG
jgi:hypothetical protein